MMSCPQLRRTLLALGAAALLLPGLALAQAGFYHTVQSGESLSSIARRYDIAPASIAEANRLPATATPNAGARLWIPGARPAASSTSSTNVSRPTQAAPARTPAPSQMTSSRSVSTTSSSSSSASGGVVVVESGDSLWRIANRHGITVADLARANGLQTNSLVYQGQRLHLPAQARSATVVASAPVSTPAPAAPRWTPAPASVPATRSTPSVNSGAMASTPVGSSNRAPSRHGYIWPVEGTILRGYQNTATAKHVGLDIHTPIGTPVRAAADGTVQYAGDTITAYGRMIIIRHDNGFASCYAYNSELIVRVNQRVRRGDVIARSGDGGRLDRPYIHFQLRNAAGNAVNPAPYLP